MEKVYDIVIVGAGPAGLAAGLYAGRSKLATLIVEKEQEGGQIGQTSEIDNYPGSIEGKRAELVKRAEQAWRFGAEKVSDTVVDMELEGDIKKIVGESGTFGKVIPGGVTSKINARRGKFAEGVSYAQRDAAFFEGSKCSCRRRGCRSRRSDASDQVRTESSSSTEETNFARQAIQEKAFKIDNLEFMWNSVVKELSGDGLLSRMVVEDTKTGEQREVLADEDDGLFGVFVFIGFKPNTAILDGKLPLENGYVRTDDDMKTSIPGVFAAGDIRVKSLRQVVTAAADGAIAATQAGKYIEEHNM